MKSIYYPMVILSLIGCYTSEDKEQSSNTQGDRTSPKTPQKAVKTKGNHATIKYSAPYYDVKTRDLFQVTFVPHKVTWLVWYFTKFVQFYLVPSK